MVATDEVSSGGGGVHLRSPEPVESSAGSALDDRVHACGGSAGEVQERQVLGGVVGDDAPTLHH